jgi:hypothetical protein
VQQLALGQNQTLYPRETRPPLNTLRKPAFFLLAPLLLMLAAAARGQEPAAASATPHAPEDMTLFDRIVVNQKKSDAAMDLYERTERLEVRKPGSTQPPEVKIARVIPAGTGVVKLPIGLDGKPVNAESYRSALEKLEHALELVATNDRAARDGLEKYAKRKKDRTELIEATRSAFLYTFVDREPRGGIMLSKYSMLPNPAYKPTSRNTAIFAKVHGFVWVDEASGQLARVEGEVTEDISVGLFLAKVYKGSHFMQENYEQSPGLWLPSFSQYDFDGRKFFSGFSIHERTFYSNYRYIGPPKEALGTIRAELGKAPPTPADP